jgi:putative N6-adenine-specific DNA methylase/tRNA (guanine6-N2)-methyltransferase
MHRYLLTTPAGIEDLTADEARERWPAASVEAKPFGCEGRVRVAGQGLGGLTELSTIHHVIDVRVEADADSLEAVERALDAADLPELGAAASFRVTSECRGDAAFDPMGLQRAAGAVLKHRWGTAVDLEQFALNVRVDLYGRCLVAGIQLTRSSLDRRLLRARALRASLKPTLAAGLVRLAGAHRGAGRLLDPCCGTGTIPIEAKRLNAALEAAGSDWDAATVEAARRTVENHGLDVAIRDCDARSLASSYEGAFDWIVTDPPYGVRVGRRADLAPLYAALLASFERVLAPRGRIVLLVLKFRSFLRALAPQPLAIVHERIVEAGGLRPHAVVLERRSG